MANSIVTKIPKIFYSSKTGQEFTHCVMCEKNLLKNDTLYIIEKAFSQDIAKKERKMIFEYAICMDCHKKISSELSHESMKNLNLYFNLYVDFEARDKELLSKAPEEINVKDWISNCIISKEPIKKLKEFQIGALCNRHDIVFGNLPFAIGYKAANEMQELLSKKTKDTLEGFKDYAFPPDVRDKIPDDRLILI